MNTMRTTLIMGAGAILDFSFPQGMTKPSTEVITKEVIKPYKNWQNGHTIKIVKRMYDHLKKKLPENTNPYIDPSEPNVHFEMLFHVMESYLSYNRSWSGTCTNSKIFPIFGPFTKAAVKYSGNDLSSIMKDFILRVMDIINEYNEYFRNDNGQEQWYRNFFHSAPFKWDVFNFNYDTTMEECIKEYEDGFDHIKDENNFLKFIPQKLWENKNNFSTINHLHGCIQYFYGLYKDPNHDIHNNLSHDLYKYPSYTEVRDAMIGSSRSKAINQGNEEYYSGPIITGLRKTDKLNCIPYDFYHGNLYNKIIQNHSMVIIGYSFGDLYMNQIIKRMNLIHGNKKRIVVIDYWSPEAIHKHGITHFCEYCIPPEEADFLMMMAEKGYVQELIADLQFKNTSKPMFSSNQNLMLFVGGFKNATSHIKEIYNFLNS